MNESIDLSVCVLSYNTKSLLRRCLRSVVTNTKGIAYELIIVDNASTDGSAEMVKREFPSVVLIENGRNRWYGAGNNNGLRVARGRYILFCNSDTSVTDDELSRMVRWLDRHSRVVAIEPRQVGDDGHIEPTGSFLNQPRVDAMELTFFHRWFRDHPIRHRFRQQDKDREKNWQTEMVSGAFLMARTDAVRSIGGFDERLKLYYTDTDLCRRIGQIGQIWHIGRIAVKHTLSQSTGQLCWWKKSGIYARDAFVYYWITGRVIKGSLLWTLLQFNRVLVQTKIMLVR